MTRNAFQCFSAFPLSTIVHCFLSTFDFCRHFRATYSLFFAVHSDTFLTALSHSVSSLIFFLPLLLLQYSSFLLFFFVAFSFKLALKQFYDTISTQQINSLATTTDGDPLSPSPFLILLLLFLNFRLSLTTSFAPRFVRPRSGSARSF